jgi:SNW domain-containing protein 1
MEQLVQGKIAVTKVTADANRKPSEPYFVRYTSKAGNQRIIRMQETDIDPMEPVRFKHRRVPRTSTEAPVPVNHSPPRKVTVKDQLDWKIPPCISNWKNIKGYTIPLEMRLSADGRHLTDTSVSDKFPSLSEALYMAERNAREEISIRGSVQKKLATKEALKKEQLMREAAAKARTERATLLKSDDAERSPGASERDMIRYEQNREIERSVRLAGTRKRLKTGEDDRDISEKIALGQVKPNSNSGLDSRLFNQDAGLTAGFGEEDDYEVFDKPLFADRSDSYKPQTDQTSSERARSRPIEFERVSDAYGLDKLAARARAHQSK